MESALGDKPTFPGATVQKSHWCKISTASLSLLGIVLPHSLRQELHGLLGVTNCCIAATQRKHPNTPEHGVRCTQARKLQSQFKFELNSNVICNLKFQSFQQLPSVKASIRSCRLVHLPPSPLKEMSQLCFGFRDICAQSTLASLLWIFMDSEIRLDYSSEPTMRMVPAEATIWAPSPQFCSLTLPELVRRRWSLLSLKSFEQRDPLSPLNWGS